MTTIKLEKGRRADKTVRAGETMEIRLPAVPSTGYSWQIEAIDPKVLSVIETRFESASSDAPRVGRQAEQVITLKAVGEGQAEVVLTYRRPWVENSPSDDTATLHVTVAK
jgi:inhibitor of cysteine peptidase